MSVQGNSAGCGKSQEAKCEGLRGERVCVTCSFWKAVGLKRCVWARDAVGEHTGGPHSEQFGKSREYLSATNS